MENASTLDFARDLRERAGLKKAYASQLASGVRRPSLELAVKIEDMTGIPPRFWIKRDEGSQEQQSDATQNGASVLEDGGAA
jgi:transcriptional regulator with XRE-family HTH domain